MSNHPHTTNDSMASVTSGTGSASRESMGAEPAAPFRTTPVVDKSVGTEAIDSSGETSQLAPSPLTHCFDKEHYKAMKAQLKERVGKRRYKHSVGVAKTAKKMAKVYGLDPEQARMAGLVHDWDKCYRGEESTQRALDLGLEIDSAILYEMPWLLHGPTAALALSREFPEWGAETFQAIERHTCGAADMSPLDCIIYVADIIEPGRDYGPGSGARGRSAAEGALLPGVQVHAALPARGRPPHVPRHRRDLQRAHRAARAVVRHCDALIFADCIRQPFMDE